MNLLAKIPSSFKKGAFIALVSAGFLHLALTALVSFAGFGGSFIAVLSDILVTSATLAALVAVPLLVLLKKREIALTVFTVLTGFWLISTSREQLSAAGAFDAQNNPALVNAALIFCFLYGVVLLGTFVLIVLSLVFKKNPLFKQIAFLGLLTSVLFGLICAILMMIVYGQANMGWTSFVGAIDSYVVIPSLVTIGCVYFELTK